MRGEEIHTDDAPCDAVGRERRKVRDRDARVDGARRDVVLVAVVRRRRLRAERKPWVARLV
jgi:hypothetical protein